MRFLFQHRQKLSRPDYSLVFNQGKKRQSYYFSCFFLNMPDSTPKIGILVGKKNIPLAVNRNRIKRMVREAFRLNQFKLQPFWLIVAAKRTARQAPHEKVRQDLNSLLQTFYESGHE